MAICTGVSNLHFQKLLLEVFEQKNWKKKLLIAAKEIMNCLFYYTTNFCFICYQNVCDTEPFYYYKLLRN